MESLPPELHAQIASWCNFAALKNLRATTRQLSTVATPLVFEHFHLGLFRSSFSNLCHLGASPSLAKHVKRFTFHADILPALSYHMWENLIEYRPPFCEHLRAHCAKIGRPENDPKALNEAHESYHLLLRHELTQEQLHHGHQTYLAYYADQQFWHEDHERLTLKEAPSRLPNLREATIVRASPFYGDSNAEPVWLSFRQQTFVGPNEWTHTHHNSPANESVSPLRGQANIALLEAIGRRATLSGTTPLISLHVNSPFGIPYTNIMESTASRLSFSALSHSTRMNTILEGFVYLTNLTLQVTYVGTSDEMIRDTAGISKVSSEVAAMLLKARNLRTLDLAFTNVSVDGTRKYDNEDDFFTQLGLCDGIASTVPPLWPFLTSLRLQTNISAQNFARFLLQHRSTLRYLQLAECFFARGKGSLSWLLRSVIDGGLQLEDFCLSYLWDDTPSLLRFVTDTSCDTPYNSAFRRFMLEGKEMPEFQDDSRT